MITEFVGPYRFLSNFWPSPVWLDGEEYPTVEHAYQAAKTLDPMDRARIRVAVGPGLAKRLGRTVRLRENWDDQKIGVMRELLIQKFRIAHLRDLLEATAPEPLQEGNRWGDRFWGVDLRTGQGANHLGRLLMEIRASL